MCEEGVYGNSLYLLHNFVVNLKHLLKRSIKINFQKAVLQTDSSEATVGWQNETKKSDNYVLVSNLPQCGYVTQNKFSQFIWTLFCLPLHKGEQISVCPNLFRVVLFQITLHTRVIFLKNESWLYYFPILNFLCPPHLSG